MASKMTHFHRRFSPSLFISDFNLVMELELFTETIYKLNLKMEYGEIGKEGKESCFAAHEWFSIKYWTQ